MLNKLSILLIHVIAALTLGYLSYSITFSKKIPVFVGILLGFVAVLVVAVHTYLFFNKQQKDCYEHGERGHHSGKYSTSAGMHGFHVDPHDHRFDPIGGVGGVGLI